jgi:hypothetical protein
MMLKADVVQSILPSHSQITTKESFQSRAFAMARLITMGGTECSEVAVEAFKNDGRAIKQASVLYGGQINSPCELSCDELP